MNCHGKKANFEWWLWDTSHNVTGSKSLSKWVTTSDVSVQVHWAGTVEPLSRKIHALLQIVILCLFKKKKNHTFQTIVNKIKSCAAKVTASLAISYSVYWLSISCFPSKFTIYRCFGINLMKWHQTAQPLAISIAIGIFLSKHVKANIVNNRQYIYSSFS